MKKIQAYQASDGQVFKTAGECAGHDLKLNLYKAFSRLSPNQDHLKPLVRLIVEHPDEVYQAMCLWHSSLNGPFAAEP